MEDLAHKGCSIWNGDRGAARDRSRIAWFSTCKDSSADIVIGSGSAGCVVTIARQLAHADALTAIRDKELAPGADITSDEAIAVYIQQAVNTFWHPVGTYKMGNDALAVVNSQLQVHSLTGLRVVDASIMPTITTGNTNAPTIMIGEKAADFIKPIALDKPR